MICRQVWRRCHLSGVLERCWLLTPTRNTHKLTCSTAGIHQDRPRTEALVNPNSYSNTNGLSRARWLTTSTSTPSYSPSLAPRQRRRTCSCYNSKSTLPSTLQRSSFFSEAATKKKEFVERRIMGWVLSELGNWPQAIHSLPLTYFSMEQMFNVVSDVENYHKFLPWCESSVVKSRRKDHILADLVIGMKPVTESYTSSVSLHRPHLIRAESTKGRYFNNMITFWKFSPGLKGQSKTCIIDFYVSLEFRSSIHANIANVFFNEVVKAMAGAFYQEAKLRYGPESIPSRKIAIVSSKSDNDL